MKIEYFSLLNNKTQEKERGKNVNKLNVAMSSINLNSTMLEQLKLRD